MIREDIKQLKTGQRELRKFGLLVGGVLAAFGILMTVRGKPLAPYVLWPGVLLVLAGLVFPKGLKQVYLAWMTMAILLGFVVSHVVLTIFFGLIIAPIGLTARLFGKDFLRLRIQPQAPTYWITRDRGARPKSDYERQF
jgi:hypothetical protein